jgi:ubiquinone biosynthesis protein
MYLITDIIHILSISFFLGMEFIKYFMCIQSYETSVINTCNYLSKKNVIYAKILQWDLYKLFNNNQVINDYLKIFNNNVPYNKDDIDIDLINKIKQHASDQNKVLTIYGDKPINSGTIALVFKGTLDDKPIAIKILRKNIYNQIEIGINNTINIIHIFNFISSFFIKQNDTILNCIKSNKILLLQQTNLLDEINNVEIFKEIISLYEDMTIPYIYRTFTTDISKDIIVMDFIEGQSLNNKNISENLMVKYRNIIITFILNMYTVHTIIHCDLHIGNIIITNDNKVCLIDFGLVITLDKKDKKNIIDLFFSIKNKNIDRFASSLSNIMVIGKKDIDVVKKIYASSESALHKTFKSFIKNKFEAKLLFNAFQEISKLDITINNTGHLLLGSIVSGFSLIETTIEKDKVLDLSIILNEHFNNLTK